MAGTVNSFLASLLEQYELKSGQSRFKNAVHMDLPIARYYPYLYGLGNPTAKTIDKILEGVCSEFPELFIENIIVWFYERYPQIGIGRVVEFLCDKYFEVIGERDNMLEKTNWFYQAIEETGSDPVLGQYHTYGLQAMYKTSEECELIEEVHDVTTDEMFATKLAILFNFYQLSPLHLKDVLIDMIP